MFHSYTFEKCTHHPNSFRIFFRIAEVDNACENYFGARVALDNPNGLADPVIAGNPMGSLMGIYKIPPRSISS